MNCIFCTIVGEDPFGQIEWRGHDSVVFTPHYPVVPGHKLVVPKLHVNDFRENATITGYCMEDASAYAREHVEGDFNVITSIGPSATQTVYHLHVHLVPRVPGDGLHLPWTGEAHMPSKDKRTMCPECRTPWCDERTDYTGCAHCNERKSHVR